MNSEAIMETVKKLSKKFTFLDNMSQQFADRRVKEIRERGAERVKFRHKRSHFSN